MTYNQLEVTNAIRAFAEASSYLSMSYYGSLVKASAFLDIKKQSSSVGHGTVPPVMSLTSWAEAFAIWQHGPVER